MVSLKKSFRDKVFATVRKIPKGKVLTYGEVALRAGNSKAARAVGAILHTNYDPKIFCHRVVRSDGKLGGYNRGIAKKETILRREGALQDFASGGVIVEQITKLLRKPF